MNQNRQQRAYRVCTAVLIGTGLGSLAGFAPGSSAQAPAGGEPALLSVVELMQYTITPASNTIWAAYEPPASEAEWLRLEEAAVTLLAAAQLTGNGGRGDNDATWAQDPRWQAFNSVMITATRDALAAIRARDHAALLNAGDVLYPPCEGCHTQFNPGVSDAQ